MQHIRLLHPKLSLDDVELVSQWIAIRHAIIIDGYNNEGFASELSHCSCPIESMCGVGFASPPYSICVTVVQTQLRSKRSKYRLITLLCRLSINCYRDDKRKI